MQLKIKSHVKLKQRPCVLAKNLCQFEYDMDVIPAHRDASEGKTSPISPIFWSSLQKYHFFATESDDRDDRHEFYWLNRYLPHASKSLVTILPAVNTDCVWATSLWIKSTLDSLYLGCKKVLLSRDFECIVLKRLQFPTNGHCVNFSTSIFNKNIMKF